MKIDYDPTKRKTTLLARGLDMADAALVFSGDTLTVPDDRQDYGEPRFVTIGFLHARMVVLVWTRRGVSRRIISLRKANAREQAIYQPSF